MANPPHRLDRYACRAGELVGSDGAVIGHALVVPAVFWARVGGHLWWRRWGNPDTTADVWVRGAAVRTEFTIRPREGSRPGRWSVVGVGEVPAGVQRLRGAGVAQSA